MGGKGRTGTTKYSKHSNCSRSLPFPIAITEELQSQTLSKAQAGYQKTFLALLPKEVRQSPSLEVSRNCGDAALRDMVSGMVGLGLDSGILEVLSSLNDSTILSKLLY